MKPLLELTECARFVAGGARHGRNEAIATGRAQLNTKVRFVRATWTLDALLGRTCSILESRGALHCNIPQKHTYGFLQYKSTKPFRDTHAVPSSRYRSDNLITFNDRVKDNATKHGLYALKKLRFL